MHSAQVRQRRGCRQSRLSVLRGRAARKQVPLAVAWPRLSDVSTLNWGPAVAALITGAALILQNWLSGRREERRRDAELAEARRRDQAAARSEWAGAFQHALLGAITAIGAWKIARTNKGEQFGERAIAAVDESRQAYARAQVASAKLLAVELDKAIRASVNAMTLSLEISLSPEGDPAKVAGEAVSRLVSLLLAFWHLLDRVAGVPDPDNKANLLRHFIEGAPLPREMKTSVLEAMKRNPPGSDRESG